MVPSGSWSGNVGELLGAARALVTPGLRAAVATLPPAVERIAAHHFGWTDPAVGEHAWGKGVRSALVLACARAVGGQESAAVPAAVAIELVHNASLIQDDLIDGDTVRRHRPAVWVEFGAPAAILVADAMFFASIRALHSGAVRDVGAATEVFVDAVQQLVAGELTDTSFEARGEVSLAECSAMTAAKTGALLEAACVLGAHCGGADSDCSYQLGRFGHHLGVAFQAVDDYLGIWGASENTGKPVLADLRQRKKSLPVVFALTSDNPAAAELASFYHGDGLLSEEQVERAADLIERTGAREWVREYGRQEIDSALRYLSAACSDTVGRDQLTVLAQLVRDREA
ncbi:polyprenyl synthetase family protein [Nocardia sp. NPDC127579]|uniref:polyprenyl synthetase family protein n=1 Tax=Nocardia sp. NPDC127579 TaxID=3345402 RepID=UPI003628D0D0